MRKVICFAGFMLAWTMCCLCAFAADEGLVAWWKFDEQKGRVVTDSVSHIDDAISGNFKYVEGASGGSMKFDGYTTSITRKADDAPRLVDAFTIEAWVAPQVYPWNWTAIVNQGGEPIPEKKPRVPSEVTEDQLKSGLFGATFSDPALSNPEGVGLLKHVNQEWTGGLNDWSARWRGYIEAPFTGVVTFHAEADNGLLLNIDKQVVIDGWGRKKARSGKFSMLKGKNYPIILSYYQDGDPSYLRLYWSWPGQQKVLVDASALRHIEHDELLAKKDVQFKKPPKQLQPRLFFGVDAEGHIGLHLAIDGRWHECTSEVKIPLLKWSHIAGTFDKDRGIDIYINGKPAGSLVVKGLVTPARGGDLLLGKSHRKMAPVNTERGPSRKLLSNMIFDGLIDEVKIYGCALSAEQISQSYAAVKPRQKQPLTRRVMPTGPKNLPPRFAATYCRLSYADEWEIPWRVGDKADILVRFDETPVRVIFWRGTCYGAAWVTENGIWMGDQSLERTGNATGWGCAEHMSDKQNRFSHVRLIEDNDARKVIHWRYAVSDITYGIAEVNPQTGWGEWADEYYVIYPDVVSTRKQILWSDSLKHEWQETIVLNQPGTRPEDNIELEAMSLANLNGESKTYSWKDGPPDSFSEPANPNIQITNLKSKYRPFIIFEPGPRLKPCRGGIRREYSHFPWWNHWPVAQLPNDGRRVTGPDRPSHSSLSQAIEDSQVIAAGDDGSFSAVTLYGMTDKPITRLVPLARSWINPPKLAITSPGFSGNGYDKYQRAYVLTCRDKGSPSTLKFQLAASKESPVVNPAFVVRNWGEAGAGLKLNGKPVKRGRDFRFGHRRTFEGSDLIVWLKTESAEPVKISLTPIAN